MQVRADITVCPYSEMLIHWRGAATEAWRWRAAPRPADFTAITSDVTSSARIFPNEGTARHIRKEIPAARNDSTLEP